MRSLSFLKFEGPREPLHGAGKAAGMRSRKKAREYLGPQPANRTCGWKISAQCCSRRTHRPHACLHITFLAWPGFSRGWDHRISDSPRELLMVPYLGRADGARQDLKREE